MVWRNFAYTTIGCGETSPVLGIPLTLGNRQSIRPRVNDTFFGVRFCSLHQFSTSFGRKDAHAEPASRLSACALGRVRLVAFQHR